MSKIFLDITELYNNRMVYPLKYNLEENVLIGEADNYVITESFHFNEKISNNGTEGIFRKRFDKTDNITCESQILEISCLVKKITFIGFCCWGYFQEYFKLECKDGTIEYAKAYFSDVTWPLINATECFFNLEKVLYTDGCKIFKEIEMKSGKGYIYYYTTEFDVIKEVTKITFPENCLMHIFAITIEN